MLEATRGVRLSVGEERSQLELCEARRREDALYMGGVKRGKMPAKT